MSLLCVTFAGTPTASGVTEKKLKQTLCLGSWHLDEVTGNIFFEREEKEESSEDALPLVTEFPSSCSDGAAVDAAVDAAADSSTVAAVDEAALDLTADSESPEECQLPEREEDQLQQQQEQALNLVNRPRFLGREFSTNPPSHSDMRVNTILCNDMSSTVVNPEDLPILVQPEQYILRRGSILETLKADDVPRRVDPTNVEGGQKRFIHIIQNI